MKLNTYAAVIAIRFRRRENSRTGNLFHAAFAAWTLLLKRFIKTNPGKGDYFFTLTHNLPKFIAM